MPDACGVIGALAAPGEGVEAPELPDGVHEAGAAGEDLVGIGLVAHVPHNVVERSVVDVVERNGELHHPEPRGKVPARLAHGVEEEAPHLLREHGEILHAELPEPGGISHLREERVGLGIGELHCQFPRVTMYSANSQRSEIASASSQDESKTGSFIRILPIAGLSEETAEMALS